MVKSDAIFKQMQDAVAKDGKELVKKIKGIYQFKITGGSAYNDAFLVKAAAVAPSRECYASNCPNHTATITPPLPLQALFCAHQPTA